MHAHIHTVRCFNVGDLSDYPSQGQMLIPEALPEAHLDRAGVHYLKFAWLDTVLSLCVSFSFRGNVLGVQFYKHTFPLIVLYFKQSSRRFSVIAVMF